MVAATADDHPDIAVMVLCDHLASEEARALLRAGARGVLSKKVHHDDLLDAVGRVIRGDRVVDQVFLPLLFDDDPADASGVDAGPLTAREHAVLRELARGASNRQIAAALVVGESTVKSHLGAIYAKLGVGDRHRAVGRAIELGLIC